MIASSLLLALLFPVISWGTPMRRSMQVQESRTSPPSGYTVTGSATPDAVLTLRLALTQSDYTGLVDALYDVSTPSSASYGAYLSKEDVEAYMAPTAASTSAVNAWLAENGLQATTLSSAGNWLSVQMPVSKADELLDAEFSVFTHSTTGKQAVRTLAYSIPTDLVGHLDLVHPTVSFPNPYSHMPITDFTSSGLTSDVSTGPCNIDLVTPACLQWLYGIPTTPEVSDGNALAVTGYIEQWPQEADLMTFLEEHRPDIKPTTTWTLVTLDGGSDPQSPNDAGIEANLDTQYTIGLATGVPVTFISVGNTDNGTDDEFAETLIDTALYMLPSPPQVMTTSYGDDEEYISENLAYALCAAYAGLGARGVSVLFASGDGGVSGLHYPEETCTTFIPTFPSGCPYALTSATNSLTSVGGTYLIPETAVNFSSGGFSTFFDRPTYQDTAVEEYLTYLGATNAGLYNPNGRAFPDVAAYAVDFDILYAGEEGGVSGTSCASPTFASVMSLLNGELLAAGRPALGFLNPWLYSSGASALNDITVGNNYACSNYTTGFTATAGWDAVTGLGTPNYPRLKAALGL
ncbi:family S53 protease [Fomitopsis serialis]|uniref:family S53 protease n=1 Tax=Fomitopsis serialis TaxID=139415 RepID=UPI002008089B|nr:family S53 protease [Neoantrodia serialis]KAH9910454.1 family S53 protease [Neoantrodia serialis]